MKTFSTSSVRCFTFSSGLPAPPAQKLSFLFDHHAPHRDLTTDHELALSGHAAAAREGN
tara:strand:- start:208 stop:384 length:177 start_codon:yes stop_codon:yes gene_type:complete